MIITTMVLRLSKEARTAMEREGNE